MIHRDHPDGLWEKTSGANCVEKEFFDDYFGGRDVGFAVEVSKPKRYDSPESLVNFCGLSRPPQSFCYI